jgi:hypothetical protein
MLDQETARLAFVQAYRELLALREVEWRLLLRKYRLQRAIEALQNLVQKGQA